MPVFALCKQRFDPDTPLAHGLLILLSWMICPNAIKILFIKTPFEEATLIARGTLRFERTCIACCRIRLIAFLSLRVCICVKWQDGLMRADVNIAFRIIAKGVFSIQGGSVVKIWERNIGSDVLLV